ncbi:hypothetical protein D3C83_193570 [compost metagenome]
MKVDMLGSAITKVSGFKAEALKQASGLRLGVVPAAQLSHIVYRPALYYVVIGCGQGFFRRERSGEQLYQQA